MRTTLTIDEDVLATAKHLAQREQRSLGSVISSLARAGMARANARTRAERNGIPLLPVQPGAQPVTLEQVNQLRDESA